MRNRFYKSLAIFLVIIVVSSPISALAVDSAAVAKTMNETAAMMFATVKNPVIDTVGGEWAVLGLARSGYKVPRSYYESYYKTVEKYLKDNKGVLHDKKYTEYSRVILALTSAGFDARDVGGYDLTLALGDFDNTIWQGINGPAFALIALDSAGYQIPKNPNASSQASRDLYITEILSRQLPDGGFALSKSDTSVSVDVTGMVLQALANYQNKPEVKTAINKALNCLVGLLDSNGGGFTGEETSESVVQVIVALCELGLGVDDPRFAKNEKTLLDRLMSYYVKGKGFEHIIGGGVDQMAQEQALYALAEIYRFENGLTNLYDMTDVGIIEKPIAQSGTGLPEKHADVKKVPLTEPGTTFPDISRHENKAAIESLAERGIITGMDGGNFNPSATMTRAQFATIVTRGLGLDQRKTTPFTDVAAGSWYEGYIGAAFYYGIITGRSVTEFDPDGLITKQDAAVMVARAAKLCGMSTELNAQGIRDVLAQFPDYTKTADYARGSLAFCYSADILSQDELTIEPAQNITRSEIAEMFYRLLDKANLL